MTDATPPVCARCGSPMRSAFLGRMCPRCVMLSAAKDGESDVLTMMDTGEEDPTYAPIAPPDAGPLPAPPPAQLIIGGRVGDYELVDLLGRGGMAVVYLARQVSLDRLVAFKTVEARANNGNPQMLERFRREARAVSRLDHPGIVSVHDFGVLPGALFYTMDYVEGQDLGHALRNKWFTARESATLMRTVAEAMGYAHAQGVVHRDLKPANILLDAARQPHIADFGLAIETEQAGHLTLTGDFIGTPAYMSPERISAGPGRSAPAGDIYALGAMLFQMLAGRTPFIGNSPSEVMQAVLHERAPSPRLLNPGISRDLETICLKCLERDPARRYASCEALSADLTNFLSGAPINARPISPIGRFTRWCRRKPAFAAVWFLMAALAVGSTLAMLAIRREEVRTQRALGQTQLAEAGARERLRDSKIAEARAIRRTTVPGRRQQALGALAEAARIRPGADLRDEALAALTLIDIKPLEKWKMPLSGASKINVDAAGTVATAEQRRIDMTRGPATVIKWGAEKPISALSVPGGAKAIGAMRFDAAGRLVMARYSDETLRVWRVGQADPILTIPHRPLPDKGMQVEMLNADYDFTPDGAAFALGLPGKGLTLNRLTDGAELARWEGGELCNMILISPDGRYAAAGNLSEERAQSVYLVSLPDLRLVHTLTSGNRPGMFAWSADSRVLAVAQSNGNIASYDVRDGRLLPNVPTTVSPSDIRFLARDSLLVSRNVNTLHFLNVALGREELSVNGIGSSQIAVGPRGDSFFVPSSDNVISRMAVETPVGLRIIPPPRATGYKIIGNVFALDFSADGRWIASANANMLLLTDAETGRLACDVDTRVLDSSDTATVAFSADGRALYRCSTASVFTRYPINEKAAGGFELGPGEPLDADPGFFIAARGADRQRFVLLNFASGAIKVVAIREGKLQTLGQWIVPDVYNAALSPDGLQLLVNTTGQSADGAGQHPRIFRVSDGAVVKELAARVSCDAAWSADGRVAMTSNGPAETTLWDTATWQPRAMLKGELGGDVTTFVIAPDSQYAVVTHDDRVHFVSTRDGALLATFQSPAASGLAAAVRFLPDGKRFAILWHEGRIDLIDPAALRAELGKLGLDW